MSSVKFYTRFERFWHWTQAFLIISMLITGFEIHGTFALFGYEQAVDLHIIFAWSLIVLWIFAIFWHLTTGEWRQYCASCSSDILAMVKYYSFDIFLGGGHPHHKTRAEKLNPLQRMAYLALHLFIAPLLWISGWLYLFYSYWDVVGISGLSLGSVAMVHTAAAFLILTFLVAHLYLALTMSEKMADLKAMLTGYQEIDTDN
ncbi:cytochrome b/b6 domain-containing protein [Solemya velum gill symbiont]|uniref:Cytochrome B n=1 Tax=Solemya velum gill symbiont TaxID=2340 RepID=A0A0B0H9M6_SOVGS|nr:cytochrome b/b6 domain-containing protein [Solemya velum gill symbiont]KHF25790.1 thiosulfate reductase, cytochrome B subunit [Solemya velum gill symbiont]OOY35624.1 cytochrome B [Solemya velum gill symbiont]OOY38252.1 cytochrome B [Solemya velum gill symbiont]OOY39155.1 cytochrome B [Solemya velum gill symbiont]OOY44054.1 cytochrome B [Solemya velum gill symbiont]